MKGRDQTQAKRQKKKEPAENKLFRGLLLSNIHRE